MEGTTELTTTSAFLYTRYESLTSRTGSRTLSERWVREHLQSLGMLGIVSIEEKNEGVSGGHYNLYGLNPKLELVVEALDETLDMVGVHDSISDYVDH
jgi:archaeal cell division control protein 6